MDFVKFNDSEKELNDKWQLIIEEENNLHAEITKKNSRILRVIKNQLGDEYYQAVLDCIMESEGFGEYQLEKEPGGHKQKEDWDSFDHIYVDQWMNGGHCGDDFAGDIWIPLKKNLYLKVTYQM